MAKEKSIEEITAELDEVVSAPETPNFAIPNQGIAQILAQIFKAAVTDYWAQRLSGEMNTIAGDKQTAKTSFEGARVSVAKIQALYKVADDHNVREELDKLTTQFLSEKKDQSDTDRKQIRLIS